MTLRVECPGCGAIAEFEHVEQSAAEFCGSCDYPLFWALPHDLADREVAGDASTRGAGVLDPSLRRRPGAAGRAVLGGEPCRSCGEPNPSNARYCLRCGVELDPEPQPEADPQPEPEPPPPPEPEPEPEPEPAAVPVGVWVAAAAACVGLAVLADVAAGARGLALLLVVLAGTGFAATVWWRQHGDS